MVIRANFFAILICKYTPLRVCSIWKSVSACSVHLLLFKFRTKNNIIWASHNSRDSNKWTYLFLNWNNKNWSHWSILSKAYAITLLKAIAVTSLSKRCHFSWGLKSDDLKMLLLKVVGKLFTKQVIWSFIMQTAFRYPHLNSAARMAQEASLHHPTLTSVFEKK